jgi:hypothetical protein
VEEENGGGNETFIIEKEVEVKNMKEMKEDEDEDEFREKKKEIVLEGLVESTKKEEKKRVKGVDEEEDIRVFRRG